MTVYRHDPRPDDAPACVDCEHYIHTGSVATQCMAEPCSGFDHIQGRRSVTPEDARLKGHCGLTGKYFVLRKGPSWLDRNTGRVLIGIIVLGALGYWLKTAGVFG